ncbi:hypothetical protein [Shewanella pealeana]|uniref:Uncharacterized protein n=1 Tax=Shewanella pealeana (strain ATCC 700345 / ANG-SQ1) TaxID=398579 RepID=A8GYR5_SHEPA|nr:hypothetical protein [Shewanella pealeana]ABV85452.1 hypothetical protein Spea_0123 [Shewanella pealeana ATCC 700345]
MTKKKGATDMSFKALVKQHIEAQAMSEQGLARMESLLVGVELAQNKAIQQKTQVKDIGEPDPQLGNNDLTAGEERSDNTPTRFKSMLALAASVLLLVFSLHWYPEVVWQGEAAWQGEVSSNQQPGVSEMSIKIAVEVAKNHIKMKPLEVQTAQLSQLRAYFTELDFTLVSSSRIDDAKQMIGGRYCSIQGLTAAQIRFVDPLQSVTLYQVQYDRTLYGELPNIDSGEKPLQLVERGVAVSIWVEKGLLMATARSIE